MLKPLKQKVSVENRYLSDNQPCLLAAWQRHILDGFGFTLLYSLVNLWPVIEHGPEIFSENNNNLMATNPGNSNEASEQSSDTKNLSPYQIRVLILAHKRYHGTSTPFDLVEFS